MNRCTPESKDKKIIRCSDQLPRNPIVQRSCGNRPDNISASATEKEEVLVRTVDLSTPVLNSAISIKNHIREVNAKLSKKITDVSQIPPTEQRTVHEKLTRKINYPFDKKLYKELIALNSKSIAQTSSSTNYGPNPVLKDKVPKLQQFYKPSPSSEYNIPVNSHLHSQSATRQFDGFRINNVIKTWSSTK